MILCYFKMSSTYIFCFHCFYWEMSSRRNHIFCIQAPVTTHLSKLFHFYFTPPLVNLESFSTFFINCNYPVAQGPHSRYCWWRTEDYTFIFIFTHPCLRFFNLPVDSNLPLVPLSFTKSFFQLTNTTTQVNNLEWVIWFLCQSDAPLDYQL